MHLKNIRRIRHLLSKKDTETLVLSVILTKIDYCNVIYTGLSRACIDKLQKLQNSAVRLIYNVGPRSSTSYKLRELHWLRIEERVILKVLLTVHKFFTKKCANNISYMLSVMSYINRLLVLVHFDSNLGRKSFTYCAPRYWNKLPFDVRLLDDTYHFKKRIKTILICNDYDIINCLRRYM